MSGFCAVPRMNGRSGDSDRARWARTNSSEIKRADVFVIEHLDRLQLMRGAEAIEEVHERDARLERRGVGDEREVVRLLHRRRRQQREPGLADRHHVGVVAEDRQRLRGQRSRGHVHTADVSSPAILYMFGIISSRP